MKYKIIGDYLQIDNDYIILYDKFYECVVPDRMFIKLSNIHSVSFCRDNDIYRCSINFVENTHLPMVRNWFFIKEYNDYIDTMIAFSDIVKNVSANGKRLGNDIPPNYRNYASDIAM